MTLHRLFEVIFNLRAEVSMENECRNITIHKNPKQPEVMEKLELALSIINDMRIVTIQPTNFPITNHTTNLLIIPLNSKFSPIIARSLYNGYKYVINK
jgi:hypothetical protein